MIAYRPKEASAYNETATSCSDECDRSNKDNEKREYVRNRGLVLYRTILPSFKLIYNCKVNRDRDYIDSGIDQIHIKRIDGPK